MYSSGASIASRSTGSCTLPSTSLVTTCGLPTVSSKPSRRISSTSTASWSSPRPCTSHVSGRSVGSTRSETLPISSASSLLFTWLAVSLVPSSPASGEVLMPTVIESDGSSTCSTGSGRGSSRSASVSPIVTSGMPGDGDDVARAGLGGLDAVERLGHVELGHLGALDGAVGAAPGDLLPLADRAVADPADREPADVRRRVEVRDERLERVALLVDGRRDRLEQQVEQRPQVVGELVDRRARPGPPSRCSRRSGTRSGSRRRRGRGRARRPRSRPPRPARRAGRPC